MMLPEHLKIGFEIYRVGINLGNECNEGDCDNELGTIQVASRLTPRRRAARLLHEILHACWDQAELPTNDEDLAGLKEEAVVARLSSVLAAALLDNPQLLRTLEEAGRADNGTCYRGVGHTSGDLGRTVNTFVVQRGSEPRSEQLCPCGRQLTECATRVCAYG